MLTGFLFLFRIVQYDLWSTGNSLLGFAYTQDGVRMCFCELGKREKPFVSKSAVKNEG